MPAIDPDLALFTKHLRAGIEAITKVVPARNTFAFMPRILQVGSQWYARECPSCHKLGWVAIVKDRGEDALTYICRRDWQCAKCQAHQHQADTAYLRAKESMAVLDANEIRQDPNER